MHFLWIDCEMSGLNYFTEEILEIACILTDANLQTIFTYESVFYHQEKLLKGMNTWCLEHHKKSGLYQKVLESKNNFESVDDDLINKLKRYTVEKEVYLAGNSVYVDKMFLEKSFPKTFSWLHYRLLDVSTLKIIAAKKKIPKFEKKKLHTAVKDIQESIDEYKYYQEILFKN